MLVKESPQGLMARLKAGAAETFKLCPSVGEPFQGPAPLISSSAQLWSPLLSLAQFSTAVPPAPLGFAQGGKALQTPKLESLCTKEARLTPPAPGALPVLAPLAPPGDALLARGDREGHHPQL